MMRHLFRVEGLRFRVERVGFRVERVGLRVRVWGLNVCAKRSTSMFRMAVLHSSSSL